jgi:ribosomal protein S18 acetylase RimI-like enzyme
MSPARFVPAGPLGLESLATLFNRGYEGYFVPIRLEPEAFAFHAAAWDLDLRAARIAYEGPEPVAFALLGVRGDRGWIGGMGVVPSHRGRGLGRLAMEAALAEARARGLRRVDLEVIEQNTWAARIYEALGFRDTRMLDVWARPDGTVPPAAVAPRGERVPVEEALAAHPELHAERAPWQRDLPSLRYMAGVLQAFALRGPHGIEAMALARDVPGALALVDLEARADAPAGALDGLLAALLAAWPGRTLSFANLPSGHPAGVALAACGATVRLRQREMTLAL